MFPQTVTTIHGVPERSNTVRIVFLLEASGAGSVAEFDPQFADSFVKEHVLHNHDHSRVVVEQSNTNTRDELRRVEDIVTHEYSH